MINRRVFIRGLGATLALPLLESVGRAESTEGSRLFVFFTPNGFHLPAFKPVGEGEGFELPPTTEVLEAHRERLLFLSGLANPVAEGDVGGAHPRGTAGALTGMRISRSIGDSVQNGVSFDQIIARSAPKSLRFSSLALGTHDAVTADDCSGGYSCSYLRNISWTGPKTPRAKLNDPRQIFDALFAGEDAAASEQDSARRRAERKSVLDFGLERSKALMAQASVADRARLESYYESVRELERRLELAPTKCESGPRPAERLPVEERVELTLDLAVLALRCDLTRVITFMLDDGGSYRSYDFLGIDEAHHTLSHHGNEPSAIDRLLQIERWEVERFSGLVERMIDAELLDRSVVLFTNELADGNAHTHRDLPMILAGDPKIIHGGRHVRVGEDVPVARLYLSLMETVGVDAERFGTDGLAPLSRGVI